VREFLDDPQAPHFLLIVGEPGIGKSAFAAYLWRRARIPDAVHFCIGGRGSTTEPLGFVQSIAEQLAERLPPFAQALREAQKVFADDRVIITANVRTGPVEGGQVTGVSIQHLEIRGLPPEAAFDRLIRRPLQALAEAGTLRPTALVVDALDEAVAHTTRPHIMELLAQAYDLPSQVRFILTSRPDLDVLSTFADLPHVLIEAQSPENQEDVTRYLRYLLEYDEALQEAVAKAGRDEARFILDLGNASEWNFLYLSKVLPEIAAGCLLIGEDILPRGLEGYYRYLLSTRLGPERWEEWGADLMEVILALQEPASLEQIAAFLRWPERQTHQWLRQASQLLNPALREQGRYWRYHWSVANFLTDRELAMDFWCDERQGHARIADYYLHVWGGLDAGLPGLQEPEKREIDGGYGLRHLAAHLKEANRADDLHHLLHLERQVNKQWENVWYAVREAVGDTAGYLDDIRRAWRLSEEEFAIGHWPLAIGLQCRYALITASVNSLAADIPPALLAALVEKGMWTPAQGLAYARQVPELEQRVEALAELLPHIPEPLREQVLRETLAVAWEIESEWRRAGVLAWLAPRLVELGYSREALAVARAIKDDRWRAEALVGLVPHLPEAERAEALRELLVVARTIEDEQRRVKALAGLAPYLLIPLLREALLAARTIEDKQRRAEALVRLAPHLPEAECAEALGEALSAARTIEDEQRRARALVGLTPYLPAPLLREALSAARMIEDEQWQAEALAGLASRLAQLGHPEEALLVARAIQQSIYRAKALVGLVPHLSEAEQEQALQEARVAARAIQRSNDRAKVLAELVPYLPGSLLPETLMAVREIRDADDRAWALAGLAPHLTEPLLPRALAAVEAIENEKYQVEALTGLASHLPEPLLPKVLERVQKVEDEQRLAEALTGLVPYLPERLLREVLMVAQAIETEYWRAEVLVALASHLPEPPLQEVLAIESEEVRVESLAKLAVYLSEPLLWEALAAAQVIDNEKYRAKARAELASQLAKLGHPEEVLEAAQAIKSGQVPVKTLARLASHLPEDKRAEVLQQALGAAQAIEDEQRRAKVLAELAPYLPTPLLREALLAARKIEDKHWRAEALVRLAPHLPEDERAEVLQQALEAARTIEDEQRLVETLERLVPYLPEPLLREALAAAQAIKDEQWQVRALVRLASHLPEPLLWEALAAAQAIQWSNYRTEALAGLVPYLSEPLLQGALAAVREIGWRSVRAKALAGLAPRLTQLPPQHLYTLWQETLPILADRPRQHLFADLRALEPVIAALGGVEAVTETFHAIQDVGRWWP